MEEPNSKQQCKKITSSNKFSDIHNYPDLPTPRCLVKPYPGRGGQGQGGLPGRPYDPEEKHAGIVYIIRFKQVEMVKY